MNSQDVKACHARIALYGLRGFDFSAKACLWDELDPIAKLIRNIPAVIAWTEGKPIEYFDGTTWKPNTCKTDYESLGIEYPLREAK